MSRSLSPRPDGDASRAAANDVYLLLGSNINKAHNLQRSIRLLRRRCEVVAVSPVYETAPVGRLNQPSFFNAVVHIRTPQRPEGIKETIIDPIEAALGRRRTADKNAPRTIDLDIILFNDAILDFDGRHIPDPDLARFPHVAVPLADLAPDLDHPETGETIATLATRLQRQATPGYDGPAPLRRRDDLDLLAPAADEPEAPD